LSVFKNLSRLSIPRLFSFASLQSSNSLAKLAHGSDKHCLDPES